MKHVWNPIRWVILSGVVVCAGCSQTATPKTEQTKSKAVPVKAVAVVQEDVERTTTQPASLHPFFQAEIKAKISGYVKEVKVDIGDYVQQDAELAILDVPEMDKQQEILEAQLERHQALETQATAGVELAKANVRSAQAKLAQSNSEMNRVDASLAAAEAEFKRTEDLVARQSLERRVLDEVRQRRDSELAAKEAVKSAILSAEADVVVAQAQQTSSDADLLVAKANTKIAIGKLDELKVLIGFATLKAPFEGVVTARSIDPGDLVQNKDAGDEGKSLFVVSQIKQLRVRMPVPESDAALVNLGDRVTLTLPYYSAEAPLVDSVRRMSQSLDPSTRTMLVEAEFKNEDGKLLPGMFGQATITLSTKVATNTLPARAVRFDDDKAYVYVIGSDETVTVEEVKTGIDDGHTIEILSGVQSGQRVIDAHRERFKTGQKVSVLTN